MKRIIIICFKYLFLFLFFYTIVFTWLSGEQTEAAIPNPGVKESNIELYSGYDKYKIELVNVPPKSTFTYKSNNETIASVNKSGTITPLNEGTAVIGIVIKNKKTYKLSITVSVKSPEVNIADAVEYLNVSETYQLKVDTKGIKGNVTYHVSDPTILAVDERGMITALAPGAAIVYAEAEGKSTQCSIEVGSNRLGTFSNDLTINQETVVWITLTDAIEDEKIKIASYNKYYMDCSISPTVNNKARLTIKLKGVGQDKIVIKSSKTTDKLYINVSSVEKLKDYVVWDAAEIYDKYKKSTVEIYSQNRLNIGTYGTGFFIGEHMVATSIQAIEGAKKIQVTTADNVVHNVEKIIGFDFKTNLAILEVDYECEAFQLYPYGTKGGEPVYILGNPLGLTGTMSQGIVSNPSRVVDEVEYIQTDASVSAGNTGSPVINKYGEVIGINTVYVSNGQQINFAVSVNELMKINTNSYVSVSYYHDEYKKILFANIIKEDPSLSSSFMTCQDIPSGIPVSGYDSDIKHTDYYRFTVKQKCSFRAFFEFEDETVAKNSVVYLEHLLEGKYMVGVVGYTFSEFKKEGLFAYIDFDLEPGDYYLEVNLASKEEKPYIFYLTYK